MDFWQQRLRGAATSRLGSSKFKKHDLHTNLAIPKEFHDHFDQYNRSFIHKDHASFLHNLAPELALTCSGCESAGCVPAHTGVGAGKTVGPECDTGFCNFLFVYSISYKYT